ncbi:hypothetical protein L6452_17061 [Arctium lappa]|uniref:Uncharacterized protein n=1 Tax=Arctium lappa TaxID=4217 RepID=A0ACB9C2J5_ARCLA|nr:hypothetical protein L6452_17061 [Arctium lappa]
MPLNGLIHRFVNLIDLAGSESSKAETTGVRQKEGSYINYKSLLTLGTVISKLTDGRTSHIPYRESKLTRLLQSSLSGHGRVSLICIVTPSSSNSEETHNTLKFAHRAKHIEIQAAQNKEKKIKKPGLLNWLKLRKRDGVSGALTASDKSSWAKSISPVSTPSAETHLGILGYDNHHVASSVQGISTTEIEEIWNKLYPNEPYDIELALSKEVLEKVYATESRTRYNLVLASERHSVPLPGFQTPCEQRPLS